MRVVSMMISILCGTLAVAGCGGGGSPAGPDGAGSPSGVVAPNVPTPPAADLGPTDGCDLLTQQEAEAAAGNPVQEGRMLGAVCIWEPEDLTEPAHIQLSIAFLPAPPGAGVSAEQLCQQGVAVMSNPEPQTGLGDSSYWEFREATLGNSGTLLVCLAAGTISAAAVGGRPEADLRQAATEIATIAVGRL